MDSDLPKRVLRRISRLPEQFRDDATSEAILALLDGRNINNAISEYVSSDKRNREREASASSLGFSDIEDLAESLGLEYDEYHGYRLSDS